MGFEGLGLGSSASPVEHWGVQVLRLGIRVYLVNQKPTRKKTSRDTGFSRLLTGSKKVRVSGCAFIMESIYIYIYIERYRIILGM